MNLRRAHLIANRKSGQGKGSGIAAQARELCEEHGYELIEYAIRSPADFAAQSALAVAAAEKDGGVVIAAGGDGTIRGVAQAAHGRDVRFAVVPCGTFNFFARAYGIPEEHAEALRLALTGRTRSVRLGEINGQVFLINANLGMYARAFRAREERQKRFGRNRLVGVVSNVLSLFDPHPPLKVDLVSGGQLVSLNTPMIFIGNNALQLRNLALDVAKCMKANLLAVVVMKPIQRAEALRILVRGVTKTLEHEQSLDSFCVDELTIYTRRSRQFVALDGEMLRLQNPLKVKALPDALKLVVPEN